MLSKAERSAHWARLVADQKSSGESISSWCRIRKISSSTFDYWRRRFADATPVAAPSSPEWLAVSIGDIDTIAGLSTQKSTNLLCLRVGKVSIDVSPGFNSALLGDVLSILESRCESASPDCDPEARC